METVVEDLLHAGGVQQGHAGVHEGVLALARQRGGLALVVVAHHHQGAAVSHAARGVGVLERVARAVESGRLAVQSPNTP